MSTTYNYSLSSDFPGGINPSQLIEEINTDSVISNQLPSTTCTNVNIFTQNDSVEIIFTQALTMASLNELNNVVIPNHVPVTNPNNFTVDQTGFIVLDSSLADNRAIQIRASNLAGGIDVDVGNGGFTLDSTNTISFNGQAESNFTVTGGNLILNSTDALVNINGGNGINIGNENVNQPVNISTSGERVTTIGNTNGNSRVDINGATGINLNTPGTGSINSGSGGMLISTSGTLFQRSSAFTSGIRTQPLEANLMNSDILLTMNQLLTGLLIGTPTTSDRTLTLPTAADSVSGLGGVSNNDSFDFTIINNGGTTNLILASNTGITLIGNNVIPPDTSFHFKFVYRNVNPSSEAVTIYRLS